MRLIITVLFSLACMQFSAAQYSKSLLYDGAPVFHGAQVTGNYPNTDFLFTVPATGERPIQFVAENLPEGLGIDASSGIIKGIVKKSGTYPVKITASNAQGKAVQILLIEIGDKLALTPPMGWNSWNVFTKYIDEKMLMEMADAMVSSGMRDLGYQYLNIDDYWHDVARDSATGKPVVDPKKFPNGMRYVADYVHSKGLKLGIYSDAGTMTCGKCFGGYTYEEIDAKTYAEWGIDLLKYDFCHVPLKKSEALSRYKKMGDALKNCGRSVVYSVCNWGFFGPWKWVPEIGGNYWRTTPDIFDLWKGAGVWQMSVMNIIKRSHGLEKYAGPGQWNDPDMLLVGNYGKGHATSANGRFKGLTDTEYFSHMAIWAMMASPLLSSCDLRSMNEATKAILMNETLLRINQDRLGQQAARISKKDNVWVYKKELYHGGVAVAFLNTSNTTKQVNVDWKAYTNMSNFKLISATEGQLTITENQTVNLAPHQTLVFELSAAK